jgi:hypothetical protein
LVMVPSKIDSPIWGMMTLVGMDYSLRVARRWEPSGLNRIMNYGKAVRIERRR